MVPKKVETKADKEADIVANLFKKPVVKDLGAEYLSQKELVEMILSDPIIFVLLNKTFRKAVNKILSKRKKKSGIYDGQIAIRKPLSSVQLQLSINIEVVDTVTV